jgi:hypothetical protein
MQQLCHPTLEMMKEVRPSRGPVVVMGPFGVGQIRKPDLHQTDPLPKSWSGTPLRRDVLGLIGASTAFRSLGDTCCDQAATIDPCSAAEASDRLSTSSPRGQGRAAPQPSQIELSRR